MLHLRRPLTLLVALAFLGLGASCTSSGPDKPTTDPNDTEAPLEDVDALLGDTPTNSELPEDGKFDAVYPAQFDLADLQSAVKSQGSRGVCSIFGTVALMEHLYIKEGTISEPDFSEQFLQWSTKVELGDYTHTGGSSARSNIRAINRYGIVVEGDWPYESSPWSTSQDERCTGDERPVECYTNGDPPQTALDADRWKLPAGRYVNSSPRSIKAFLTENESAVQAGMTFFYQSWNHRGSSLKVNSDYWSEGYVLYPNEEDKTKSLEKRAGHSILIIGWDDDLEVQKVDKDGNKVVDAEGNAVMEKGFWLFKNSWGTSGFGIRNPFGAGYGWLSMKYVEEYASVYGSDTPDLDFTETCDNGEDDDYDGDVDCDDADCADEPACNPSGLTFSNSTSAAIPDNDTNGVTSTIEVTQPGTVDSVAVTVDISHPYIGDLTVTLIGPDDTRVVLHNKEGTSADDIRRTYTPAGFAGKSLLGTWTLEITDTANSDTGTLNSWGLTFQTTGDIPEVCDDGIDNDGNGDTDCADEACVDFAGCQTAQSVSQTNNTPVAIPDDDPTGATSTITITEAGTIDSLAVDVNITHTFRPDLIVTLESPAGTVVTLFNQEMDGEENLIRRFTPPEYNGEISNGTWTLTVVDGAGNDVGTLNEWTLEMEITL